MCNFYQITYKEGIVLELEESFVREYICIEKLYLKIMLRVFFRGGGGGVLLGLQDLKKTWNFCVYSWVVLFTKRTQVSFSNCV